MKVKLAWRIGLTPVAILALPLFIAGGAVLGMYQWIMGLIEFWRGE